jgi:integrase/recombinase XerD
MAKANRTAARWQDGDDLYASPESRGRSVAVAIKAYLADCVSRNLAPASLRTYTRTLNQLSEFLGQLPLASLTVERLAAFRDSRRVKPRTQRKELEFLRAFCAFCVLREWLPNNPAKRLRPPKIEDVATRPFTREETDKLIAACDRMRGMWNEDTPYVRQRAKALLLVLLYSGLRVSDVATLKRSALLPSGHLVLRTEKTGTPVKVMLKPDAITALKFLPAPSGNTTYYFWSGHGDWEDCAKSLWRTLSRLGRVAGVHAHPHRCRDTFAVELLTGGADIRTVQKLLGHDSVKTTEKHYAHFVAAHQTLLDAATATLDFSLQPATPLLVSPVNKRRRNS